MLTKRFALLLMLAGSYVGAQDSLPYFPLVKPADTLYFETIHPEDKELPGEFFTHRQLSWQKVQQEYRLLDSLPGSQLVAMTREAVDGPGQEFLLGLRQGDTLQASGFRTYRVAGFRELLSWNEDGKSVLCLVYEEQQSSTGGSAEFEIAACFQLEAYPVPLSQIVRHMWVTARGSYEPNCRDFQFYSIEFSRDLEFRRGKLYISPGMYKYSRNVNCQLTNQKIPVQGGVFVADGPQLIRQR